jgi:Flp pilus assembly protein TadB
VSEGRKAQLILFLILAASAFAVRWIYGPGEITLTRALVWVSLVAALGVPVLVWWARAKRSDSSGRHSD